MALLTVVNTLCSYGLLNISRQDTYNFLPSASNKWGHNYTTVTSPDTVLATLMIYATISQGQ